MHCREEKRQRLWAAEATYRPAITKLGHAHVYSDQTLGGSASRGSGGSGGGGSDGGGSDGGGSDGGGGGSDGGSGGEWEETSFGARRIGGHWLSAEEAAKHATRLFEDRAAIERKRQVKVDR